MNFCHAFSWLATSNSLGPDISRIAGTTLESSPVSRFVWSCSAVWVIVHRANLAEGVVRPAVWAKGWCWCGFAPSYEEVCWWWLKAVWSPVWEPWCPGRWWSCSPTDCRRREVLKAKCSASLLSGSDAVPT